MLLPNEKIMTIPLRSDDFQHASKDVGLFSEASGKELQGGEMSRYKDALCSNQLGSWAHHADEQRANLCYSVNADLSDTMAQ